MDRSMSQGFSAAADEKKKQRLGEEEREIRKELSAIDEASMQKHPVFSRPQRAVKPSSSNNIIATRSGIGSKPSLKPGVSVPRSEPPRIPSVKKKYAIPRSQPVNKQQLPSSTNEKYVKKSSRPSGLEEKAQNGGMLQDNLLQCEVEVRNALGILRGTPSKVHCLPRGEQVPEGAFRLTRPQGTQVDLARLPLNEKFDGSMGNLVVLGHIREKIRAGKYRNAAEYLEDMKRFSDSTKRFYRIFVPELLTKRSYEAIERHSELLLESAINAVKSHCGRIDRTGATSDGTSRLANVFSRGNQLLRKRKHSENAEESKRLKVEPKTDLKPVQDDNNCHPHKGLEAIIKRSVTTAIEKLAAQSGLVTREPHALERILIALGDNKKYLDERIRSVQKLVQDTKAMCKSLGQKFEDLSGRVDTLTERFGQQVEEPNLEVQYRNEQEDGELQAEGGLGSSSSENSSEKEASSSSGSSGGELQPIPR